MAAPNVTRSPMCAFIRRIHHAKERRLQERVGVVQCDYCLRVLPDICRCFTAPIACPSEVDVPLIPTAIPHRIRRPGEPSLI